MKYTPNSLRDMKAFYDSLSEKDRRLSAALEAAKLGHGGTDPIATVPRLRSQDHPPRPARVGRRPIPARSGCDGPTARIRRRAGPRARGDEGACHQTRKTGS